ncbi:MAG: 50S ribosomal protein L23 [Candidatus Methanogasteraceae archaeon]|nr:MAG: 50S ribosomal protein L23P [ANME-2 cluster archaeon]MEA1865792.1 50S ribosomal protein L23 [Euryarchaeota archaeon]
MTIEYPFITEKATIQLEENNKLQFIVDVNATKNQIKRDIEGIYGFDVASIRTMITPKGKKKAIVTFVKDDAANDLATRIGLF